MSQSYWCWIAILLWVFSCGREEEKSVSAPSYRLAIELVFADEAAKDSLFHFQTDLDVYHWKNHVVLLGEAGDTLGIAEAIGDLPLVEKKVYEQPFYVFDKQRHCEDDSVAGQWRDYLLTANLVEDLALQREYLTYHETQFEEWPDVSQGFCHADFQQLLLFRNDRQLLLVISVPADRTLDELNPKTVENNPQMVEWNQRMGKYQEGIEGTEEGEVWVFLEPSGM